MDLQLPAELMLLLAKQVHFHSTELPADIVWGVTTAVQASAFRIVC